MWTTTESPLSLSTDEKTRLIREFAALSPSGEVVLTGGETMRKTEEFFALLKECRCHGLRSACNTNGSFIDEHNYRRLLEEGPDYLVISLDSHHESLHDYVRGVPGAYRQVVCAIKALVAIKATMEPRSRTKVFTNTVIFEENIRELMDYVTFAEALNLDGIIFQLLSRTFWNQNDHDVFFTNHFFRDLEVAKRHLSNLAELLPAHPIVHTKANDLRWMQMYVDNPNGTPEQVCGSHDKNIMVDSNGNVKLCFNMSQILPNPYIENVRNRSLAEIWTSENANAAREVMEECRRGCGMLNCHRKDA